MSAGTESGIWMAGCLDEIFGNPLRSARDLSLSQEEGRLAIGLDSANDCYSLFSTLRNADLVRPSDDSLITYVAALR